MAALAESHADLAALGLFPAVNRTSKFAPDGTEGGRKWGNKFGVER